MKKTLLTILFSSQLLFAQTMDTSFGGTGFSVTPSPSTRDITFNFFTNPDHSIVALGSPGIGSGGIGFTTFRKIYKTSQDGVLDTSFGTQAGGLTSIMVNQNQIIRLNDGKFITLGTHFGLVIQKFNADGTLDTTFGNGGTLQGIDMNNANGYSIANDVIELDNGQFLVAGAATDSDNKLRTILLKINPNGTLDTSFGTNGKKFIRLNTTDTGSIAYNIFRSNNKIILVGADGINLNPPTRTFYVARLNMDGTLDTTYGSNGRVLKSFNNDNTNYIQAVRDEADNVYIGSWCKNPNATTTSTRLMKVTSNGTIDTSFGTNGVATYVFLNIAGHYNEMIKSIAVGSNGIYMGGYIHEIGFSYEEYASGFLSKFNMNGTPDLTFGNNGFYTFFGPGDAIRRVTKVKFDDKKRLLVSGDSPYYDREFTLARFNIANETLGIHDTSIKLDEIKTYPNPANDFVTIQSDKNTNENIDFKIVDASGRLIKSGNSKLANRIDLHDLKKGIYFIQLTTKNGKVYTEKIIKE